MEKELTEENTHINVLKDVLLSAKAHDYSGYSKFDALNSPFLNRISFNNSYLRFLYSQLVNRSAINLRPLFGVKKSRNPKGVALFVRAYLYLYEHTKRKEYLKEAENLLSWLLNNPSPNQKNLCWGYNFTWQNVPPFIQFKNEPNVIVSTFMGEALIHAYRVTNKDTYLESARSITEFIISDLPVLYESEDERAIAYILSPVKSIVLNNQVLTGAFLVKVAGHTGENELVDMATKQLNFTVNRRSEDFTWTYSYPAGKYKKIDNYHTGGILDALLEYYEETGDDRYNVYYWKGLEFYKEHLFEENGAPRWMVNKKYPHDIHGSAQGIISFHKAARHRNEYEEFARTVADWAIGNLYRAKARDFAYRQGRFKKWDYSLMRWCNAWMARAIGEFLK